MSTNTPRRGQITIPRTPLAQHLDEVERLKRQAVELLHQLEQRATEQPVVRPGRWRHHPDDWPANSRTDPTSR